MIVRSWRRSPPPHRMIQWIASALGWERPEDLDETPGDPEQSFPDQFQVVGRSDMPLPILDFDLLREKNEEAMKRIAVKQRERLAKSG